MQNKNKNIFGFKNLITNYGLLISNFSERRFLFMTENCSFEPVAIETKRDWIKENIGKKLKELSHNIENNKLSREHVISILKAFRESDLNDTTKKPEYTPSITIAIQAGLKMLGLDPGNADGVFGEQTKKGIYDFQIKYNLEKKDGIPGKETIGKMLELLESQNCIPNTNAAATKTAYLPQTKERVPVIKKNNIDEYFNQFSEESRDLLKERYNKLRQGFLEELENFAEQTKGKPINQHIKKMLQEYRDNIDDTMLNFFDIIGLKENPEVQRRFLENTEMPKMKKSTVSELNGSSGEMKIDPETNKGALFIATDLINETYGDFKNTIIHEFMHNYVQAKGSEYQSRNRLLNEGITEMLTSKITKTPPDSYLKSVQLANALYDLDKNILMNWYVGGDSENLKNSLIDKLKPSLGESMAKKTSQEIIKLKNIDFYIRKDCDKGNEELIIKESNSTITKQEAKIIINTYPDNLRLQELQRIFGPKQGSKLNRIILQSEYETEKIIESAQNEYFNPLIQQIKQANRKNK